MTTLADVCTRVCTGEPNSVRPKLLESLATFLPRSLSVDDCSELVKQLSGGGYLLDQ